MMASFEDTARDTIRAEVRAEIREEVMQWLVDVYDKQGNLAYELFPQFDDDDITGLFRILGDKYDFLWQRELDKALQEE